MKRPMSKRPMRKTKRSHGGTMMNSRYVLPSSGLPNASSGSDLLSVQEPNLVRRAIGGSRRNRTKKGGFVPSVMEGFVGAAKHYIVPMAMYAGYKLMHKANDKSKKSKKTKKSRRV